MSKLRVGTDCSGIESPLVALQRLNYPFHHFFSSEIDKNCRDVIEMNFDPDHIYEDIKTRDHSKLPYLDLYVAGFPCQAFSNLRHNAKGFQDPRGTIFFECLETIKQTKPLCFILENVRGILSHDSGKTFSTILQSLNDIGFYHVYFRVLNSIDFNLPQNRPRVFIVGIQKNLYGSDRFTFPEPVPLTTTVSSLMDQDYQSKQVITPHMLEVAKNRVQRKNGNLEDNYIVNVSAGLDGFGSAMLEVSPCLLASSFNFYSTKFKRMLTGRECLRLQGFPEDFKTLSSERVIKKQAGNSISVNVLMAILKQLEPFLFS
jgi:DNA (cytosine-5)-methyltransferase 1